MDVDFAARLGADEVGARLGPSWRFELTERLVDNGKTTEDLAGVAVRNAEGGGVIAVWQPIAESLPVHAFLRVVLHEIAHGLDASPEGGHGPDWERIYLELTVGLE